MKILFLSKLVPHVHGISGSLIIHNRIRGLAEQGHEVSLLSFCSPEESAYVNDIRPLVREVDILPAPDTQSRLRRLCCRMCLMKPPPFCDSWSETMARRCGEMVERNRYDVVIAEFSVMGQYLYENPHLPAVRRILSCHECCTLSYEKTIRLHRWTLRGFLKRLKLPQLQRYEFSMYRNMDHILTLTSQEKRAMLRYEPTLRITAVPHSLDLSYYAQAPTGNRDECIMYVGYYSNESNRDAVLWFVRTVWPDLKTRFPNLKFFVIGRGVTPAICDLGRRDARIIVTGEVADIRPYLAKARAFICPVRMGSGFRAKILEAMAVGVPVVTTSMGAEGIPIWNGETLMMADTPDQMLKCISILLTDSGLRESLIRRARELVINRFSREQGLFILNHVLDEVVTGYD